MPLWKTLTARCEKCGKVRDFHGQGVKTITKKIDGSGWYDGPNDKGGVRFLCPKCYQAEGN